MLVACGTFARQCLRPMLLALKIDVDTLRGTREGVPHLVALLKKHGADATFLFSLGPDHTGRAIKRVFRPGFFGKVRRTSVVKHYGLKTLLYGTLLPGPDIGRRAADVMRATRDAGFEIGIHAGTTSAGRTASPAPTPRGRAPRCSAPASATPRSSGAAATHGAAGWQMNVHALRLTQRLGFDYCSDGRGTHPHLPVWNAELIRCPQLPTTLPTLDELIGRDGITEANVAAHLLELTREPAAAGHVFTLHAELEGMRLAPVFEQLLAGWKAQGWQLVLDARAVRDAGAARAAALRSRPRAPSPAAPGTLLVQGDGVPRRRRPRARRMMRRQARPVDHFDRVPAARALTRLIHQRGGSPCSARKSPTSPRPPPAARRSGCPPTRATRSSSISIRRTTRPAARPRARISATCTSSSRRLGAIVVGISRDSLKSHENFKAKMEFPFELLSDADEKLCAQFDVIKMKNMYGKQVRGIERSTFVIDGRGQARPRVARRQGARPRAGGARTFVTALTQ